jgi:hypothetical protein
VPTSKDPRKRARQFANLKPANRTGAAAGPGNRRAIIHGGTARVLARDLDRKTREIFDVIRDDLPVPGERGDAVAIKLLATCMVRLDSIAAFIRDRGQVDPKTGELRESVFALERSLRNEARDHLEGLALNPRSRYRIGIDYVRGRSLIEQMEEDFYAEHGDDHQGGDHSVRGVDTRRGMDAVSGPQMR